MTIITSVEEFARGKDKLDIKNGTDLILIAQGDSIPVKLFNIFNELKVVPTIIDSNGIPVEIMKGIIAGKNADNDKCYIYTENVTKTVEYENIIISGNKLNDDVASPEMPTKESTEIVNELAYEAALAEKMDTIAKRNEELLKKKKKSQTATPISKEKKTVTRASKKPSFETIMLNCGADDIIERAGKDKDDVYKGIKEAVNKSLLDITLDQQLRFAFLDDKEFANILFDVLKPVFKDIKALA